jgi:hypothetical protein
MNIIVIVPMAYGREVISSSLWHPLPPQNGGVRATISNQKLTKY